MNRRGFLLGAGAASGVILAAPSIVRAASIMAIKPLPLLPLPFMSPAEWNAYRELIEKVIRSPITEAMQDLIVFGQSITRVTADGGVRVPPSEWYRSLPVDSADRLSSVPLK